MSVFKRLTKKIKKLILFLKKDHIFIEKNNLKDFVVENFLALNTHEKFKALKKNYFHSQYGEDLILAIAFNDDLDKQGFYIDVGANSPHEDSVTKLFYDLGWKGINIEPIAHLHDQLQKSRPNDLNLPILIGKQAEEVIFCEILNEAHGLSTANSEEIKKLQEKQLPLKTYNVKQKSLDQVFEECNVHLVSFLKIDVEGNEKEVLESITLSKNRPTVIVVESTFPCTMTPSYQDWEHIITTNDYVFALSSGINRYYVRKENLEYLPRFILAGRIIKMFET